MPGEMMPYKLQSLSLGCGVGVMGNIFHNEWFIAHGGGEYGSRPDPPSEKPVASFAGL